MADQSAEPALAEGIQKEQALRDGGFNDDEVSDWKSTTAQSLQDGGFSAQEVRDYFGQKNPDMSKSKAEVKKNLALAPAPAEGAGKPVADPLKPVEAKDVWDAMAAGWGNSITGLIEHGAQSKTALSPNATMLQAFASNAAQFVGDAPAMAAGIAGGMTVGAAAGGAAGTAVLPAIGTLGGIAAGSVAGGAAGGFAVPAAMRKVLIDHYQRGDIQDAGEFARRVVDTTWEAAKGAATGLASAAAGPMGGALAGTAGRLGAEAVAQTVVSSALEGKLPEQKDFINGAVSIAGLHAVGFGVGKMGYVAGKLANIYAETGAHPAEVIEAVNSDPALKGELLSQNPELPKEAGGLVVRDQASPPAAAVEPDEAPQPGKSAARDEILSRIGEEPEQENKGISFDSLYAKHMDYTRVIGNVLEDIGKDTIDEKNAHVLMRLHAAVQDKVAGFLEQGTRDWDGKQNGESFQKIINDYKEGTGDDSLNNLRAYGIAARTLELAGRGIEQPGTENATDTQGADREFLKNNPEVQPFFDRLVSFKNRVLDYLGSSGRYSPEQIKLMKDLNQRYISFKKILEPDPLTGQTPSGSKAIKAIGDSDLMLRDPIVSTIQDVGSMIKLAHETEAKNMFIGAVIGEDAVSGAKGLSEDNANKLTGAEVKPITDPRFLLTGTVEPSEEISEDNAYLRRAKNQGGAVGDSQIESWVNGKRTIYDTRPEIAEALKRMAGNRQAISLWTTLLRPFATAIRMGTVNNPLFALRHAWRNQMTAPTLSQTGLKPFEALAYTKEFLENGQSVQDFKFDGGSIQKIMETGQDYLDKKINDLDSEAPFRDKAWNTAKSVGALSHWAITANDNLIRFAEYKKMLGRGASRTESAFAAREVLPDFQKAGLQKSALTQITAFLNVHAQGIARMGQETKDNPLGYVAKSLAYMTVPSLLLAAAQHDDDAIKDLPDWQKFNYWNIHMPNWRAANSLAEAMSVKSAYPSNTRQMPDGTWQVNDGPIVRIQKPFTNGILFGSAFDAAMDSFKKDSPEEFENFVKTVGGSTFAEPIPSGAVGPLEQAMNRNFYTGQPIVRHSMENKLPEFQYDAYTSETAKLLAKSISYVPLIKDIGPSDAKLASPKVIDNYIHGWTGTMGTYAIDILDKGLVKSGMAPETVKPIPTLADIPFVKEFVIRFPNAHPQSVEDFLDRYEKADEVHNTIKTLLKQGNVQEAVHIQDRYQVNMDRMTGVNSALKNLNAAIQKVNQTPDIDPVQKRQLIDGMMFQMTSMAKEGNNLMDEFEKNAKNKKAGK